jgi:hypothetical protein
MYDFVGGFGRRDKQSLSNVKANSRVCVILCDFVGVSSDSAHRYV